MFLNLQDESLFSIFLSFKIAFLSTLLVSVVGTTLAYFMATKNFRGKFLLEVLTTLPLVLPPTVTGFYLILHFGKYGYFGKYLYELTDWSILFTWWSAVLASFVVSLPLMVKSAEAAISSVDRRMVEASYLLGYSEFETAIKIILPLSKRGILAGIILSFARGIGEFGATLMVAGNIPFKTMTMPLSIYTYVSSGEWDKANIMVFLLTSLSMICVYLISKVLKRNES